jgi:hypothetical protein
MRILLLISFFICSFEALVAQECILNVSDNSNLTISKQRKRNRGGLLKIGVGINSINVADPTPKLRFHIGFAPTIDIKEVLYIKPEMAFSLKGGNVSYAGSYFDGDVTYRLSYLEFPLVFGFKPLRKIALEFGGYGAVLLGGNFDFSGTFFTGYGEFNPNELNSFDYGLTGGIVFSQRRVKFGLRYYHGLQNIANQSTALTFLGSATNHTIQVYIQRSSLRERIGNTRQ